MQVLNFALIVRAEPKDWFPYYVEFRREKPKNKVPTPILLIPYLPLYTEVRFQSHNSHIILILCLQISQHISQQLIRIRLP